jgi:seryl-tRNA synthetase
VPPSAPKANIDIKHIRQNPTLHEENCLARNYKTQSTYPARINLLFDQWQQRQREGRSVRERSNLIRRQIANPGSTLADSDTTNAALKDLSREQLLEEARALKA